MQRSEPERQRLERHTTQNGFIRDAIIGLADGLTVPFALTAGLSSIGSSKLVILGGVAELFAGSISMGLGAYLATITDAHHFEVEEAREQRQVTRTPHLESELLVNLFERYGITYQEISPIIENFRRNPHSWVKFMMDFELKLERPSWSRPWFSALIMGLSYFIGGLIPMIPYFTTKHVNTALFASIGATRRSALYGSLETLVIGAIAAGASYGIVKIANAHLDYRQ
ncbi:CCC1 [Fusarium mundagurra]|uniref:CCC1 n=1 Tax=Fusarium mundagurra TaxID=1567541 RepID=A0A8H5Y1Z3_9HYPO|nr:CCC1 [Fusarium mundagurra]